MQTDHAQKMTEISFEDTLTSIREDGVFPVPQTGLDQHKTIRLHQARNPRYLARYDEEQVAREIQNGADVVVCIYDWQVVVASGKPSTLDRPAKSCGCSPDSNCPCMSIMTAQSPKGGFTDDLENHQSAARCAQDSPLPPVGPDLHDLAGSNHRWSDRGETRPPDSGAKPGLDQLRLTLKICQDCGKYRAQTRLLPVIFGGEEHILDTFIINPDEEASAAWLHDVAQDRMVPCTKNQHRFAMANVLSRLDTYT